MRWMRRTVLGLVALAIVAVAGGWLALNRSNITPGGTHLVDGLAAPLEIRFDHHLRPYVTATSLADALFAEGWLHARYRLWQMELLRRAGKGTLSAALGDDLLDADKSLWRAGVPQLAEALEAQASEETLALIDSFVAGANAGIESYPARPPEFVLAGIEFSPWRRRDVFAVGAVIAFQSANNMQKERLRLALANVLDDEHFAVFLPDESTTPGFPYVLRDPRLQVESVLFDALDAFERHLLPNASLGSSGWALSPSRSATGNALFAFDSHDALSMPTLFYEVHLFYGDGKSIRGWSLPGLPGVINGFNGHLAWGMTNIGDTQDLFVETRNPDNPSQFLHGGEWITAESRNVTLIVKGRGQPVSFEVLTTTNGTLVEDEPPISLRWTGHDTQGRGIDALLGMNTAESWEEFEAAINQHAAPSANITYADRDGRIAFRTIGLLPQRRTGGGLVPLDGSNPANGWNGLVPDEKLPMLLDPDDGYVAAANARVHDGEPLISADNAAGYRIQRLHEVLSSGGDFTLDDMRELQLDEFNIQAARLLPHMLPRNDAQPAIESRGIDALGAWLDNPVNSADSAGALIWEHWYPRVAHHVFREKLGSELLRRLLRESYVLNHALDRLIASDHDSPWWQGRREAILHASLVETLEEITARHGNDPKKWRWDAAHSVSFRHELHGAAPILDNWLSRGPYPWGGGHAVLARARYNYDNPFEGRAGATVRVVIEMGNPMAVRAIMPGGQHGHPVNRHYDDQLPHWLAAELSELAPTPVGLDGPMTVLQPAN